MFEMKRITMKRLSWVVPLALLVGALAATPLWAGSITIQSDATNLGASVASASDPTLVSGVTSGLTFTLVSPDTGGTYTSPPPGAPAGTLVVEVPLECGYYCGLSGFVEQTFVLPSNFTAASLSGAGNVDDWGYVFLNGNLISSQLSEFGNVAFSTDLLADFQSGVNTLVISDSNSGGGPSGVAYYADITYETAASVTPEPGTFLLLGSGLVGLAGFIRRKIGLRA
jgi:hypothetical protein